VFLLESAVAAAMVAGYSSEAAAAAAHLTIAATLTAWVIRDHRDSAIAPQRKDLRLALLLTVTTAFMGPIGAGGTLAAMAFMSCARSTTPFEEWYRALFPETATTGEMDSWQRIISGQDIPNKSSVAPFSDILCFGTLAQKQELISLMSRSFQPVFAPVLRAALTDSNNAIRVQAASAITVIEDDFLRRSLSLTACVRENPRDSSLLLQLARLHDDYASAGILDHDREGDSRNKALKAYGEYLQLNPKDLEARTAIGRLFLRAEEYQEAMLWSAEAVENGETSSALILTYMEALYQLRRFGELRRLAAKHTSLAQSEDIPLEAVETLKLWASTA
jgi:tetratricopeptide (TPR) repeat protein